MKIRTMDNLYKKTRKRRKRVTRTVNGIYTLELDKQTSVENEKGKSRKPLRIKGSCFFVRIYNERNFLDREMDLWYDIDINNAY